MKVKTNVVDEIEQALDLPKIHVLDSNPDEGLCAWLVEQFSDEQLILHPHLSEEISSNNKKKGYPDVWLVRDHFLESFLSESGIDWKSHALLVISDQDASEKDLLDWSSYNVDGVIVLSDSDTKKWQQVVWMSVGKYQNTASNKSSDTETLDVSFFEKIVSHANIGMALTDAEGRFLYSNRGLQELLGYTNDELKSLSIKEVEPPEAFEREKKFIEEAFQNKRDHYRLDQQLLRKDGSPVWIDLSVSVIRDDSGQLTNLVGSIADITESKKAQSELRSKRKELSDVGTRLELAVKSADLGIWDLNLKTGENFTNDRWWEMLGYSPEEQDYSFDFFMDLLHPDEQHLPEKAIARIESGEQTEFELLLRLRAKDGEYRYIMDRGLATSFDENGKIERMVGTHMDVTDQMMAQEDLAQSEKQYRMIYNAVGLGVGYHDPDGYIISYNEIALASIGKKASEVVGKHMSELYGKEHSEFYLTRFEDVKANRHPPHYIDGIEIDGSYRWFKSFYSSVSNAQGEIQGFLIVSEDITSQRNTELALAESEKEYRFLTESLNEIVWKANSKGGVTYINQFGNDLLGANREVVMEQGWAHIIHPDEVEAFKTHWKKSEANCSSFLHEHRIKLSDGSYRWFKFSVTPDLDEEGSLCAWIGICSDIHEQKEAEKRVNDDRSRMQYIAERSAEMLRFTELDELYHYVGDEIHQLFDRNAVLILTSHDQYSTLYEVKSVTGITKWAESFFLSFPIDTRTLRGSIPSDILPKLSSGKLEKLEKNLFELANGGVEQGMVDKVDELIPEYEIFSIGFVDAGKLMGATYILHMGEMDHADAALVELFCSQVSGALSRLRAFDKLRQSEDRFRGVISSFKDIVFTLDTEGCYSAIYGSWIENSPFNVSDLLGKTPMEVYGDEFADTHNKAVSTALQGRTATYEWNFSQNDSRHHYQTTLTPLHNTENQVIGLLGVGRDITDRWQYEQTIISYSSRLNRLAKYSSELMKIGKKKEVYGYIAEVVYDIIEKKGLVIVAEMDEEVGSFEIESIHGLGKMEAAVLGAIGRSPVGMTGRLSDFMIAHSRSEDLINLSLDMTKITNSGFAKFFPKRVMKMIGIRDLKVMMVLKDGLPIASVTLALSDPTEDLNTGLLRTFLNQASLALTRSETVKQVFESQRALEEAQRLAQIGSWTYQPRNASYTFSKEAKRILEIGSEQTIGVDGLLNTVDSKDRARVKTAFDKLYKGEFIEVEYRFTSESGHEKWIALKATPISEEGSLSSIEGTIHDITQRKRAELRIVESEVRFRNLIEHNSTDVIMVIDTDLKLQYVSPSVKQVLGYSPEILLRIGSIEEMLHEREKDEVLAHFESFVEGSLTSINLKSRLQTRDRSPIWASVTISDQRTVPGVEGFVLNIKDIDQEERTSQQLKESYERYELVTKATKDVIWDYDIIENVVNRSITFEEMYGHTSDSDKIERWTNLIHPKDREETVASIDKATANPHQETWTKEYRIRRADGSYAWVLDHASILRDSSGKAVRMIGAMSDITDRITYEQSIEAQNEKLKDIAWMQSHIVRAPLANLMALVNFLKHDQEGDRAEIEQMIFNAATELDHVIRNIVKNAERFERQEGATTIRHYGDLGKDLQELYLHPSLLDLATRAYTITNKKDQVVYANAAFEELSGYSFEEIKGNSHSSIMTDGRVNKDALHFSNQKERDREPYESEVYCRRKDGTPFWMRITAQPFISKHGTFNGYLYTLKDTTSEKKAEQTIIEKTNTLARINDELKHFTYTISHDLKEPVNSLKGLMELLQEETKGKLSSDEHEYIVRSLKSVDMMSSMVRALLEYSKSGNINEQLKTLTFEKAVNDVKVSLRDQIAKNDVHLEVHNGQTVLRIFPLQFSRILQNLITNSIKFRNVESPVIELSVEDDDFHWKFSVRDNGIGIDNVDKDQVFDLFYYKSHSEDKESHGIGLAVVKRLVEQHEGDVSVESELGKGTTFTFTISKHL